MAEYEGVLLVDPQLDEESVGGIKKQIEEVITGGSGEIDKWEGWGRKRLAYEINGKTDAIYVLLTFKGGEKIIRELTRICGLKDDVLRYIFVKHSKGRKTS